MSKKNKYPNFFIVGAPRSGTTFIHSVLQNHRDIFSSHVKEPAFFKYKGFDNIVEFNQITEIADYAKNKNDYLALYKNWENEKYCIDASTHYFAKPQKIAKDIYEKSPDSKIIVFLRNPIDRIISHNSLHINLQRVKKDESIFEIIEKELILIKKNIEPWSHKYSYIRCSSYLESLKIYHEYFQDNFRVYLFEDIKNDLDGLLNDITKFLDIDNISTNELKNLNKNKSRTYRFSFLDFIITPLRFSFVGKIYKRIVPNFLKKYIRQFFYNDLKTRDIDKKTKEFIEKILKNDFSDSIKFSKLNNILYESKK